MISGARISNKEQARATKSEAFGRYALDLINENRAVIGKPAIEWN